MKVNIPISIGELFDKITILEIKQKKIKDNKKKIQINNELNLLKKIVKSKRLRARSISLQVKKLKMINVRLWNVEDKLRKFESNNSFNKDFIKNARKVYFMNDKRAELKNQINQITHSQIVEVKSYEKY